MREAVREDWPEYLMEAGHLGLFMMSACVFTTLIYFPESQFSQVVAGQWMRRLLMGLAMGLTGIAIVYSPWGRRSGAHFNPAVTLTFWRLGKVAGWDATFYILAQVLGGFAGVVGARLWLGEPVAHPAVRYAVTRPGSAGPLAAFGAEIAISFGLMLTVLVVSNSRWAPLTGLCAGTLVATYIVLEAPLSGMSMNPARTLASAVPAASFDALWVYLVAPIIGMFLAADLHGWLRGRTGVRCAKLYHHPGARCIFRRGYAEPAPSDHRVLGGLALLLLSVLVAPTVLAQPGAPSDSSRGRVQAVGAIGLTVSDMGRSVAFYSDVLGFQRVSDVEVAGAPYEALTGLPGVRARVAVLQLGRERIELTEYLAPRGRAAPADSRSNDAWFQHVAIVTSDIQQAYLWLRLQEVRQVSPGPQRLPDWNPKAGGITAFYFRDPDGHPLEILEFPADKGDARWRRPGEAIFLGIDHTAIVVADTERSLRFYRDLLGLRVTGESENWGLEQERLSGVLGAHLRITTLRAAAGPGVELLEYLSPRTGRAAPVNVTVNDLVHWHTTLVPTEPAATAAWLRQRHADFVSRGVVSLPDRVLGFETAFLARDPDGHALRVIEQATRPGPAAGSLGSKGS